MANATQTIYGLISDGGDGSASMRWYRTMAEVEHMLDEDNGYESFWAANEGSPSEILTFPADLDLNNCGFTFDRIEA